MPQQDLSSTQTGAALNPQNFAKHDLLQHKMFLCPSLNAPYQCFSCFLTLKYQATQRQCTYLFQKLGQYNCAELKQQQ